MRIVAVLGTAAAAGALAVSVPAAARPPHSHPAHPDKSQKCTAHKAAYRASGALVSWSATRTSTGTYTGTITVRVTTANHHARGAKGTDVTYTLAGAKVVFGKRANPPVAGDRVTVIGKITEVAKKCTSQTGAGTVTVRKVIVHVSTATA
jgi:hypothetical protein